MDEKQAETLETAYGKEAEGSALDVSVDGKVVQKELDTTVEETQPEEKEETQSFEELKAEAGALRDFYSNILGYTKPTDPNDENSARTWDLEKIVDELGYEFSSLQEKGAKVTEQTPEQTPEQKPTEQVESSDGTFTKEQVAELVQNAVQQAVAPLQTESKNRKAKEIVTGIREKYPDFNKYQTRIGELAKNFKVETAQQLEALYFAARGEDSANEATKNTGLSDTVGRPSKFPEVAPEVADAVMAEIVGAGSKPANVGIIKELTGGSLSPLD
jgi:hypothetical protein